MAEENNNVTVQDDSVECFEVFPIQTARDNAKEYGNAKYIQKFSNSIISRINDNIKHHSKQGETDAQIVMSCLEIYGDYPIQRNDPLLQSIVNMVVQRYSAGGYVISTNTIPSDAGIKGIMFTVSWEEAEGEIVNEI